MTKKLIVPFVVLAAVVCAGGIALAAEGGKPPAGSPPFETGRVYPVEAGVTAGELWSESLSTLRCYEETGAQTTGPFPSTKGEHILYTFDATAATKRVDRECSDRIFGMIVQFENDDSQEERQKLIDARAELVDCVKAKGLPYSTRELAYPDQDLELAAYEHRAEFRACAEAIKL